MLLKQEFLPSDYDDQLWEEIKARKQGKSESVSIFIAIMETLFNRLSRPPCEITRIKHIRQNLLPQYFSQLALSDIENLSGLSKLCKKLEDAHLTQSKFRQPHKPYIEMLEPELAYVTDDVTSEVTEITVSKSAATDSNAVTLHKKGSVYRERDYRQAYPLNRGRSSFSRNIEPGPSTVKCWNCGQPNHTYAGCKLKRKKFCYRCGYANVTVFSCPKCSGNL